MVQLIKYANQQRNYLYTSRTMLGTHFLTTCLGGKLWLEQHHYHTASPDNNFIIHQSQQASSTVVKKFVKVVSVDFDTSQQQCTFDK